MEISKERLDRRKKGRSANTTDERGAAALWDIADSLLSIETTLTQMKGMLAEVKNKQ